MQAHCKPWQTRAWVLLLLFPLCLSSCAKREHESTRISLQLPSQYLGAIAGTRELGLGERLFINRGFAWRDGILHIPSSYSVDRPAPLLVWLHGGGGHASHAENLFPIADEYGVVVLAIDSRHNTWDGIDSPFGPDVRFIQKAMQHTFDRVALDTTRIALGGLSDGASYALALGVSNGDVFTHLVGVSPWRLRPPSPVIGSPRIFIAHGIDDNVYPEWHSRQVLAPALSDAGYEVTYFAFDGPHWVTDPAGRAIMHWLTDGGGPGTVENTVGADSGAAVKVSPDA